MTKPETIEAPAERADTRLVDQAFLLLRTLFTVAPILFGLDKFLNLLTDWTRYLAPAIDDIVPDRPTGRCWPSASSKSRPVSWWPCCPG